jgi:hypothetical protein
MNIVFRAYFHFFKNSRRKLAENLFRIRTFSKVGSGFSKKSSGSATLCAKQHSPAASSDELVGFATLIFVFILRFFNIRSFRQHYSVGWVDDRVKQQKGGGSVVLK